ncbi:MAG: integrase arm-type DNA-binding domain-containing protein [Maritimibacter sp.]|nr:integrase arm-type DNA-binding domain-containing protein [Maritimibacter sp.]
MALTDAQIRALKPVSGRIRRSDGGGLYLDVMASGRKVFRLAYRLGGQQRTAVIGDYPETRLADARLKAASLKASLKAGVDPNEANERSAAEPKEVEEKYGQMLWRSVAIDYLRLRQQNGAAPRTLAKLDRQVGVTIQALGDRPLDSITAQDILDVVNPIAAKGQVENAHEIRSRFSQIFRYAGARGLVIGDPASVILDAMVQRRRGEFAGITVPSEVGKLMRDLRKYAQHNPQVGAALLLSAYLFPRNMELRGMRWAEIDSRRSIWEIPGDRMKMKRDHLVPLPRQAKQVLATLQGTCSGSPLVFPSPQDPQRMISDMTFNSALRRMGYRREVHVHHGFRTTASTNLNEMGWNADWIERQLAHVQSNKVRSSYNKAEYLEGRVRMMQAYADWLDELERSAKQ